MQGEPERAHGLALRALDMRLKALGGDHPDVGHSLAGAGVPRTARRCAVHRFYKRAANLPVTPVHLSQ
jgi:hypothetical protein